MKVQEASRFPNIKIVNFDWLTASTNSQSRADEAQFSFGQTDSNRNDATNSMGPTLSKESEIKGKGRKRPRSPTPIGDEPFNAGEAMQNPSTKRHKDVQRATSSSLLIPVDETCHLAGKVFDRKCF